MAKLLLFYFFLTFRQILAKDSSLVNSFLKSQLPLHKFHPHTLWLSNNSQNLLETLETPLILGNMGKELRQRHTHFASFVFLIPVEKPFSAVDFVKQNGNRRKDRFIFMGQIDTLRILFGLNPIKELKDKIGLILGEGKSFLITPRVYSKDGEMSKVTEVMEEPLMGRGWNGRHIKITGCLLPTWLYRLTNEDDPQGVTYSGSNYKLFLEASKKFNFTFEIHAPPTQGYGTLLPNGTWTGQVSDLIYTERGFDLAILLGHFLTWYPLIDFASNLDFARLMFVTGQPKLEINAESFMRPFQKELWLAIVTSYGVISFVIFLFLGVKFWRKSSIKGDSVYKSLGLPFSVALEQNMKVPRNVRSLVAIWMIVIIITGTGYRSNLASFLSVPVITPGPSTYEELASHDNYQVILNVLGVAEQQFFDNSDNPTMQGIQRRLKFDKDPTSCAIKAFMEKNTACISWVPLITAFASGALSINPRLEPLLLSSDSALIVSMSVGFVKDSILVDAFTKVTESVVESGVYNKWVDEGSFYLKLAGKERLEKSDKSSETYKKLKEFEYETILFGGGAVKAFNLYNLTLPFYILLLGCLISGLGFLLEFISSLIKSLEKKGMNESRKIFVSSQLGYVN